MDLIDTHCHLDGAAFDSDRKAVIERAVEAGVQRMITVGVDVPSSHRAVELAEQHAAVYAAVGIHPNDCAGFNAALLQEIRALARHPKVVAIGEIGLDYYWHTVDPATQAQAFQAQLGLAAELAKPVIIHSRAAAPAVLMILENFMPSASRLTGTLHSYFDDREIAWRVFALGFYVGITGPITFKKSDRERALMKELPLDRLLLETDAPYLTPVPQRGKRNEPAFVRHIAALIAQVREQPVDEIARQSTDNAERLFSLE